MLTDRAGLPVSALLRSTLKSKEHTEFSEPLTRAKEMECHLLKLTEAPKAFRVSSQTE